VPIKSNLTSNSTPNLTDNLAGGTGRILFNPVTLNLRMQVAGFQLGKTKEQLVTTTVLEEVTNWLDFSGNNIDGIQTTNSFRAIYTENAINGHPGLVFDGIDDFFILASQPVSGTTPRTIFAVARADDAVSQNTLLTLTTNSSGDRSLYDFTGEIGVRFLNEDYIADSDSIVDLADISFIAVTNSSDVSDTVLYKNGAVIVDSTPGSGAFDTMIGTSLIGVNNSSAEFLKGVIGEILVYDRVLSTPEINSVFTYLSDKWAEQFRPTVIPNNILWLNADDPLTIVEDDPFKVERWKDQSPFKINDPVQTTDILQPLTRTNTINGRNVISWDIINDLMRIANSPSIETMWATGATIAAVIKSNSGGGGSSGRIFDVPWTWRKRSDGGNGTSLTIPFTITNAGFQVNGTFAFGVPTIIIITYDASDVENLATFYKDGAVLPHTILTVPDGVYNPSGADVQFGNTAGGTRAFDGDFAEIAWYDRILTDNERNQLFNYLSPRWGIPLV